MIKVNVQLPVEYYNILSMFGTMDEVTAKALELCENGEILLETLPPVYADETSKTFQVVINNNYLGAKIWYSFELCKFIMVHIVIFT